MFFNSPSSLPPWCNDPRATTPEPARVPILSPSKSTDLVWHSQKNLFNRHSLENVGLEPMETTQSLNQIPNSKALAISILIILILSSW